MFTAFGHWIVQQVLLIADMLRLIGRAFSTVMVVFHHGRRPTTQVFYKQVYFTGLEALKVVVTISLILGTVIITQIINMIGTGNEALSGKVLVWVVVKELGPLLTAILVTARSGTAIATELGGMKINGEIQNLETLGIDPDHYLIMPRILGVTAAVVLLTFYFEVVATAGGFLVASIGWHIPLEKFSQSIFGSLTLKELFISFIKSLCFGLFLAASCCRNGLSVGNSATQIPQAATKGVMLSLFFIFILDGIITLLTLL